MFNALTGSRQRVGNWPGVTVEKKNGEYHYEGVQFEVVDLPGTYSRYGLATLSYQAATWAAHPASSLTWVALVVLAFTLALLALRRVGLREGARGLALPQPV